MGRSCEIRPENSSGVQPCHILIRSVQCILGKYHEPPSFCSSDRAGGLYHQFITKHRISQDISPILDGVGQCLPFPFAQHQGRILNTLDRNRCHTADQFLQILLTLINPDKRLKTGIFIIQKTDVGACSQAKLLGMMTAHNILSNPPVIISFQMQSLQTLTT